MLLGAASLPTLLNALPRTPSKRRRELRKAVVVAEAGQGSGSRRILGHSGAHREQTKAQHNLQVHKLLQKSGSTWIRRKLIEKERGPQEKKH